MPGMRSGLRVQGTADRNPSGTSGERTRFPAHDAPTGHLRILPPMRAGERKDGGPMRKSPVVPPTVAGKVILVGNPNVGKSVIFGHLQVCDAKNMRRSLLITIQLAEMGVPLVIDVNMADEARNRGVMPKLEGLEGRLGRPAVPTVPRREE